MKEDEAADPADVCSLGLRATVAQAECVAHAVEEPLARLETQRPFAGDRQARAGVRVNHAANGMRAVKRLGPSVKGRGG